MAVLRDEESLDFSGLEDERWREPSMGDFGLAGRDMEDLPERDQDEIRDNFLLTVRDGDDFTDQKLPVVDPQGDLDPSNDRLNKRALDNADARLGQVKGITEEERMELDETIDELQGLFG